MCVSKMTRTPLTRFCSAKMHTPATYGRLFASFWARAAVRSKMRKIKVGFLAVNQEGRGGLEVKGRAGVPT